VAVAQAPSAPWPPPIERIRIVPARSHTREAPQCPELALSSPYAIIIPDPVIIVDPHDPSRNEAEYRYDDLLLESTP
jgi:hypothetical protein